MDSAKLASLFETVKVLPLRPGDILVIRCKDRFPMEAMDRFRALLEKEIPGHRILVLENGTDIEVLRREDATCAS